VGLLPARWALSEAQAQASLMIDPRRPCWRKGSARSKRWPRCPLARSAAEQDSFGRDPQGRTTCWEVVRQVGTPTGADRPSTVARSLRSGRWLKAMAAQVERPIILPLFEPNPSGWRPGPAICWPGPAWRALVATGSAPFRSGAGGGNVRAGSVKCNNCFLFARTGVSRLRGGGRPRGSEADGCGRP